MFRVSGYGSVTSVNENEAKFVFSKNKGGFYSAKREECRVWGQTGNPVSTYAGLVVMVTLVQQRGGLRFQKIGIKVQEGS